MPCNQINIIIKDRKLQLGAAALTHSLTLLVHLAKDDNSYITNRGYQQVRLISSAIYLLLC